MPGLGQGEGSLDAKDSWLGAGLRGMNIHRDHTDQVPSFTHTANQRRDSADTVSSFSSDLRTEQACFLIGQLFHSFFSHYIALRPLDGLQDG